jgi:hypothetical protein
MSPSPLPSPPFRRRAPKTRGTVAGAGVSRSPRRCLGNGPGRQAASRRPRAREGEPLHGRRPKIVAARTREAEYEALVRHVTAWRDEGVEPHAIGVAARSNWIAKETALLKHYDIVWQPSPSSGISVELEGHGHSHSHELPKPKDGGSSSMADA